MTNVCWELCQLKAKYTATEQVLSLMQRDIFCFVYTLRYCDVWQLPTGEEGRAMHATVHFYALLQARGQVVFPSRLFLTNVIFLDKIELFKAH